MIAGPPGSMKTIFILNIVKQMGPDIPTLYHSSDSDDFTMASRTLSMATGMGGDEAELAVMSRSQKACQSLQAFDHVKWSFDPSPTIEHMRRESEAFREARGTYPHHTIVDILSGIDYEGVSEYNYNNLMMELNIMAREQETCMTLIHHSSESAKTGAPAPRSAILGKPTRLPTLVLSLWGDSHDGRIDAAVVKNRFGPSDPTGEKYFSMKVDPEICFVEEGEPEGALLFKDGPSVPDPEKVNLFNE